MHQDGQRGRSPARAMLHSFISSLLGWVLMQGIGPGLVIIKSRASVRDVTRDSAFKLGAGERVLAELL